jgi:hypothetical protein
MRRGAAAMAIELIGSAAQRHNQQQLVAMGAVRNEQECPRAYS